MGRFKKCDNSEQAFLLPPSIKDWLPKNHLAWFIADTVDSLDIDEILDAYRECGKGELPYHPRMLLKVLAYAYATGTFSSRKIAKQLEENVAYRVLAGNQMPGHRSICRFRERHLDHFSAIFTQVIAIAMAAGLTRVGAITVDGTKLKANASKHKAMSYERMCASEEKLRKEIDAIVRLATNQDAAEDVEFGPDFRGDELPKELSRRETRLKTIQDAKTRLEDRKAEEARKEREKRETKALEEGREAPKTRKTKHPRGKPKPKDQENFTDPDSRIMKDKGRGFSQCFNAQIAVEEEGQIIVSAKVGNCAADNNELMPMIEEAQSNTGQAVESVLADSGYRSEENFERLEAEGIDAYVPLGRVGKNRKTFDPYHKATARMASKMKTESGRQRYKKRKHIVEPAFGWVKQVLGFRCFSLRGLAKVNGEWSLVCTALNLRRIFGLTGGLKVLR